MTYLTIYLDIRSGTDTCQDSAKAVAQGFPELRVLVEL